MRLAVTRHLGAALEAPVALAAPAPAAPVPAETPPLEFNGRDYLIFLLRVAAEIEHSLMVQYLFAAYSFGGPRVPSGQEAAVRAWQETVLGIAKEEMAHLVTIQNMLTALGAPLNFNREDYPYASDFYPFGFKLQPASLDSIAAYVCAESPQDWDDDEAREIKARAQADSGRPVNRVGELYAEVLRVLDDPGMVGDDAFDATTVDFQASWSEWGRGYRQGQRGREAMSSLPDLPAPELLIIEVASRASAIDALRQVGEQGEGLEVPPDENESHFRRFLAIYRALKALGDDAGKVVRPVATNPTTEAATGTGDATDPADADTPTEITHPEAVLWAHLFNVRYRKLLVNLSHAFELSDDPSDQRTLGPRGALIHRTFAEMYHLRSIAGQLVRLPAAATGPAAATEPDPPRAGPPFQMPYTLMLPRTERDRWRLHRDLLDASARVGTRLTTLGGISSEGQDYLAALSDWDGTERAQVELLITGSAPAPVPTGGPVS